MPWPKGRNVPLCDINRFVENAVVAKKIISQYFSLDFVTESALSTGCRGHCKVKSC